MRFPFIPDWLRPSLTTRAFTAGQNCAAVGRRQKMEGMLGGSEREGKQ